MFCSNCGTKVNDNANFCPQCGATVNGENQTTGETVQHSIDNKKKLNILGIVGIVVAAVVAVVVFITLALFVFSGGYKKAIKNNFEYLEKGDAVKLWYISEPQIVSDQLFEDYYGVNSKEYAEIMTPVYETFWESLEDEGEVKLSYEIKEAEAFDDLDELEDSVKEILGEEDNVGLDDFIDYMDYAYDDCDFNWDKIKKAYAVEVKYKLKVDGDNAVKDTKLLIVYKCAGNWYVWNSVSIYDLAYELDEEYENVYEDFREAMDEADMFF